MQTLPEPDLSGEQDWIPLEQPDFKMQGRNFVSGDPDGDRLRVRYYRREAGGRIFARAWFGSGTEGPPGHVHGGSMAALMDEAMGVVAWMNGHSVVAAQLTVRFRTMLPLGSMALAETWVHDVERTKVYTQGRLTMDDGTVIAESEGLFVQINPERFSSLFHL